MMRVGLQQQIYRNCFHDPHVYFSLHACWVSPLQLSVPEFLPTCVSRAHAFDSTRRESERTADIFHRREDISPPSPPPRHVALLARI